MGKKTLCGWDKSDIKKNLKELRGIVANPQYVCKRCARAASRPDVLCKPVSLATGKKSSGEDDSV